MIIKLSFYRWEIDKNYEYVGDHPEYCLVYGATVEDVNRNVQSLRDHNDMAHYTPWQFDRVVDVGVN